MEIAAWGRIVKEDKRGSASLTEEMLIFHPVAILK